MRPWCLVPWMAFLVMGCSDSPLASGGEDSPTPDKDPWEIGPAGGTVVHSPSGLELQVPAGALSSAVRFSVVQAQGASVPEDVGRVGATWIVGPVGPLFDPPAVIALPLDSGGLDPESLVIVRTGAVGPALHLRGTVSTNGTLLRTPVPGLGTFWITQGRGVARSLLLSHWQVGLEVDEEVVVEVQARDLLGDSVALPVLRWIPDDTTVVMARGNGRLLGMRPGTTRLQVMDEAGLATASVQVEVSSARPRALEWVSHPDTLFVGGMEAAKVRALDVRGNELPDTPVEWSVSAPDVLDVTAGGLIRARAVGEARVRAFVDGPGGRIEIDALVRVVRSPIGLSPSDHAQMTEAFRGLSEVDFGSPWVQQSQEVILSRRYTGAQWEAFFREYFATHYLTWNLQWYLRHVSVHWEPWPREELQAGLAPVFLEHLSYALGLPEADAGARLTTDEAFRNHVYALSFTLSLYLNQPRTFPATGLIASAVQELALTSRRVLKLEDELIGPETALAHTRTQVAAMVAEAAEDFGWSRDAVADWLGLGPVRARIYRNHGTLINDNGRAGPRQLEVIESILDLIPAELLNLVMIAINDYLYQGLPVPQSSWISIGGSAGAGGTRAGVNVFGLEVGQMLENPFPSDVPSHQMDVFAAVVAHEVNHVVDCCSVRRSGELNAWIVRLLAEAGDEPEHFLRSMVEPGFFTRNPQEFFASMSNQWFGNSRRTVELGLARASKGIVHPLNQALFFAEVYSMGSGTTYFYEVDTAGNVARHTIPLERDARGFIRELRLGDVTWRFQRSADGSVLGWEEIEG